MIDHQPIPVSGYKPQSQKTIDMVNKNKAMEEEMLRVLDELKDDPDINLRWLAIGREHLEQAFMAINRSIFKPDRVKL